MQVDAALFPTERPMGWGDSSLWSQWRLHPFLQWRYRWFSFAWLAEGFSIRRALVVLKDHGYLNTILVSHYFSITQHISLPVRDSGQWLALWWKISSPYRKVLNSCSFKHISSNLNVIAHRLARLSERTICNFSIGVILDCILGLNSVMVLFDQ
jgi:hypothetical protein